VAEDSATGGESEGTRVARFDWRTGAVVVVVAVTVLIGMMVLAEGTEEKTPRPRPSEPALTELDFAVWGTTEEIAAYQSVVDTYNAKSLDTNVTISSWPTVAAMLTDVRSGRAKPDLYLLPRSELAETIAEKRNLPLLDLVAEREIPIGDDFAREAVEAFSVDNDLQCMPYTVSPMVIYYNTKLVDFDAMAAEDLPVPKPDHLAWNFAEFRAAAEFASRPRLNTRGVHIDPTLRGLAPFIYSGGGQVFNEADEPTSLTLGEDGSVDALRQTLELLRDPRLTLSTKQLAQRPALKWFERGKLGMIAGFRNLTPQLRASGVDFDVMPMPNLGSAQTVGDLNGICLSRGKASRTGAAANFLSYLVEDDAVGTLAETGYIEPAKRTVALSDQFLQPDLMPEHAVVFTNAVRSIVPSPLMQQGAELRALVDPDIEDLLTTPFFKDLRESLLAIDEKSRSLLDPDYEPSDAPSEGSSDGTSPSGTASSSASSSATDDRERD
jgi:multiple sugar transport system substrate-binding protein